MQDRNPKKREKDVTQKRYACRLQGSLTWSLVRKKLCGMRFGPDELQLPADPVDLTCMLQGPRGVQVLEGWQIAANYLLSRAHDLLWSALIPGNGRRIPDGDEEGEDVVLWCL